MFTKLGSVVSRLNQDGRSHLATLNGLMNQSHDRETVAISRKIYDEVVQFYLA